MKIENIQITKQMLSTVKGARKMYQSSLEAKQITADADRQERARKRKLGDEVKQMEREKKDKEHKFQFEAHLLEEEIKKKGSRTKLNEGY